MFLTIPICDKELDDKNREEIRQLVSQLTKAIASSCKGGTKRELEQKVVWVHNLLHREFQKVVKESEEELKCYLQNR